MLTPVSYHSAFDPNVERKALQANQQAQRAETKLGFGRVPQTSLPCTPAFRASCPLHTCFSQSSPLARQMPSLSLDSAGADGTQPERVKGLLLLVQQGVHCLVWHVSPGLVKANRSSMQTTSR